MAPLEPELRAGLEDLGLGLTDGQIAKLLGFAELLGKWTRVYNLTALRHPSDIVTHHLFDCAAVVGPLKRAMGERPIQLLDVGSGGGLPGTVIAIVCPDSQVDCVDAVAKKAAFVQQVAATLILPNLRGLHARVEQLRGDYDVISSRAFASLSDFVTLSRDLLRPGGCWMAMKGRYPADEVAALPADVEVFHVEQLQIPRLEAERCLVWLRQRAG